MGNIITHIKFPNEEQEREIVDKTSRDAVKAIGEKVETVINTEKIEFVAGTWKRLTPSPSDTDICTPDAISIPKGSVVAIRNRPAGVVLELGSVRSTPTGVGYVVDFSSATDDYYAAEEKNLCVTVKPGESGKTQAQLLTLEIVKETGLLPDKLVGKQDKLIAGENITIVDNVISAAGGGVDLDPTLTDPTKAAPADVVGNIKTDIATLNNDTETSVEAGKVWTTTADGAEWKTPTGGTGGVKDVQINGASVVENGVANVPIANGGNVGVVRVSSTYGTLLGSPTTGSIGISKATNAEIDSRGSGYKPIVPNNLDYAIKAAMCDGKGAAWDEPSMQAGRERLGLGTIKSDIEKLQPKVDDAIELVEEQGETRTITNDGLWHEGYYYNGLPYGETGGTGLKWYHIEGLHPNDTITFNTNNGKYYGMEAFNGNIRVASACQWEAGKQVYNVPDGVDNVFITIGASLVALADFKVTVTAPSRTYYAAKGLKTVYDALKNIRINTGSGVASYHGTAIANTPIYFGISNAIKKDCAISVSAMVGATFNGVIVGVERSDGTRPDWAVEVTNTSMIYHINGNQYTTAHGLTIKDNVQVTVNPQKDTNLHVRIESAGAVYNNNGYSNAVYTTSKPFVKTMDTCEISASYALVDDAEIWAFGDSYTEHIGKGWMAQVFKNYPNNVLANGFGGARSVDAFTALETMLTIKVPKYILWCMGMNDGSDTASESSAAWKGYYDKVVAVCNEHGIMPIFATIPTVPSINHEMKNATIRNSGYQVVDFAAALGATSAGVWYDGMLSSDNVHPTELGHNALYGQLLVDCPQVMRVK